MERLVSVVIPVYNAESYLTQCVKSVLCQSYKNIQVILVNDGSKDGSPKICDHLAEIDKRVSVIHQENKGLSEARNAGYKIAQGDFLLFLDSDDFWIYKDGLETLLQNPITQKEDFMYLEFNRCRYIPSKDAFINFPVFPDRLLSECNPEEVVHELVTHGMFPMSACTKLLNKKFLDSHNISFIPGLLSEDTPWFMDILMKGKGTISYTNYYLYGNRAEVLTSLSSTFSEKKVTDILWIIDNECELVNKADLPNITKNELMSSLAYKYCLLLVQSSSSRKSLSKEALNDIKKHEWILRYDIHPKIKRVNLLRKYLGRKLSITFLSLYMKNRDKIKKIIR